VLKHIGTHNDKKIVLLYREVPGEDHMCLVAYSDLLPRLVHDEVMKILESPSGQQSPNLSDALFTHIMPDGKNCLESLHRNGLIKKVPTNLVKITPNKNSSVMLNELNVILNEMSKGEDAVKRLKDLEKTTKSTKTNKQASTFTESEVISTNDTVLTDQDLAAQRLDQAKRMRADAARLLTEAENLEQEATSLMSAQTDANPEPKKKTKAKKG
jgi:hypothetical protein